MVDGALGTIPTPNRIASEVGREAGRHIFGLPRAPYLPSTKVPPSPPGASIDANIAEAKKHRGDIPWFIGKVRPGGSWDYKLQGENRRYEDFGNRNYGATGAALGLPDELLLRAAGLVQRVMGTSPPGSGQPWSFGSYGDDPNDQSRIKDGLGYYRGR
jgi:hypothetical protein